MGPLFSVIYDVLAHEMITCLVSQILSLFHDIFLLLDNIRRHLYFPLHFLLNLALSATLLISQLHIFSCL